MARIIRLKINWTGFVGSPGYTNLHFETVDGSAWTQAAVNDAVAITQTWLAAFRPDMPTNCLTGVDSTIAELDENHGNIEAFWTATVTAPAAGAASGQYAGGSGVCVNWGTDGVWGGRRVRGRTFIVPIGILGLQSDGTLDGNRLTAWRAASNTFAGAANLARLVIWRKPSDPPLYINGGAYDVNTATISDKVAQLRSRRD